jgi:hypothetical protein
MYVCVGYSNDLRLEHPLNFVKPKNKRYLYVNLLCVNIFNQKNRLQIANNKPCKNEKILIKRGNEDHSYRIINIR